MVATAAGAEAGSIVVGSAAPGSLTTGSGDITCGFIDVGGLHAGELLIEGGTINSSSSVSVGTYNSGGGLLRISGGLLTALELLLSNSAPSEIHIEGSDATITVNNNVDFGDAGELIIYPTANGAAGLTSIDSDDLEFNSGGTLELDTSLYAPQVGDSWDVFTYTGTVLGNPGATNLVAPAGYTIIQDSATPGLIKITVTAVPSTSVPAAPPWGLMILSTLLLGASVPFLRNRAQAG
ncbi:MAG: hypothetical protein GY722_23540 [bacterium]|nr:hypothetical protein [bacterium]